MKTPPSSLLARARRLMQNGGPSAALKLAPLAALGLAGHPAAARAAAASGTIFDPANATTGSGGVFFATGSGGSYTGAAITPGSNGVTGVSYSGSANYVDSQSEGGAAGQVGSITMFTVSGNGSGALSASSDMASIAYEFTLGTTAGPEGADPVAVTGFTLNLSVTTSVGTSSQSVTVQGGAGTYGGTVPFALDGADAGATLVGYTGSLTVDYRFGGSGSTYGGGSVSVTIPAGDSIDFNAVPEPSTWLLLATGVIGTGFQLMRVRQRRPHPAPSAA